MVFRLRRARYAMLPGTARTAASIAYLRETASDGIGTENAMARTFDCTTDGIDELIAELRRRPFGLVVLVADAAQRAPVAERIGKALKRPVRRLDSDASRKYIGETEKNLSRILARAQEMEAILFFDEADALFGKRTTARDSHDRYANQLSAVAKDLPRSGALWLVAVDTGTLLPATLLDAARAVLRCSR